VAAHRRCQPGEVGLGQLHPPAVLLAQHLKQLQEAIASQELSVKGSMLLEFQSK
jgi:hypothetical protein